MFGIAIATAVISPIAFLATGFYQVSRRRAEEGRLSLAPIYRSPMQATPTLVREESQERLAA